MLTILACNRKNIQKQKLDLRAMVYGTADFDIKLKYNFSVVPKINYSITSEDYTLL